MEECIFSLATILDGGVFFEFVENKDHASCAPTVGMGRLWWASGSYICRVVGLEDAVSVVGDFCSE